MMSTELFCRYTHSVIPKLLFFVTLLSLPKPGITGEKKIDLMVVLDLSGSMKQSGGAGRYARLFQWLDLFTTESDRLGVVAMGYGARLVTPLRPSKSFDLDAIRSALRNREKYTDVAAGLENAYYELNTHSAPDSRKVILLYSDAQIDMPGGEWDETNAKRYLIETLNPALKVDGIRFVGVVPDGLKANFQLLHELSGNTGGTYYRGIPSDAADIRSRLVSSTQKAQTSIVKKPMPKPKAPVVAAKVQYQHKPAPSAPPVVKESSLNSKSSDESAGTPDWVIGLLILFGAAIAGMFGFVFMLFRRQQQSPDDLDELSQVLNDVHSLKQMTSQRRISSVISPDPIETDGDTDESDPDFGEPKETITVNIVSPFLDYNDAIKTEQSSRIMDDIATKPAFSPDDDEDNLSLSNMETLLGTASADVEKNN